MKQSLISLISATCFCCVFATSSSASSHLNPQASSPPPPPVGQQHDHQHQPTSPSEPKKQVDSKSPVPDITLIDQDGNRVKFYSDLVQGKVVAINFIFTNCRAVCPTLGANFAKVQSLMGEGTGQRYHLISISTDPVTDTPQRLKAWAARFDAKPGWTLLTGEKAQVDLLLRTLTGSGVDTGMHSPVVIIGDDTRSRWMRESGLASPARITKIISGYVNASSNR